MLKRRPQIRNRYVLFKRNATGPYANKFRGSKYGKGFGPRTGNLWTDNPDSIGAGWTDNGDGTYTASGADGTSVSQNVVANQIIDGETYEVSFEITGYSGGFLTVYLGGTNAYDVYTVSANGSYTQDMNIASPSPSESHVISLVASQPLTATIGNIVVKKK